MTSMEKVYIYIIDNILFFNFISAIVKRYYLLLTKWVLIRVNMIRYLVIIILYIWQIKKTNGK